MVVGLNPTPANAYTSFNGYLSGLQYALIDLDPADGISPSISFSVMGSNNFTQGWLEGKTTDYGTETTAPGQQITAAELSRFNLFRAASFFAGPVGMPLVMSASGAADMLTNGGLTDSAGNVHANAVAKVNFDTLYTLSARTKVTFKIDYWFTADNLSGNPQSIASMTASVYADSENNSDRRYANISSSGVLNSVEESGSFEVTAWNNTLSNKSGTFSAEIRGDAVNYGAAPAVPEPETWALMLSGLLAVGFAAKRSAS